MLPAQFQLGSMKPFATGIKVDEIKTKAQNIKIVDWEKTTRQFTKGDFLLNNKIYNTVVCFYTSLIFKLKRTPTIANSIAFPSF